ncbi:MAG: hypothetical protein Q7T82_04135 [Armatimonadota bacterium]|nr:hypothetical protein [Armatimonadota bacterium]
MTNGLLAFAIVASIVVFAGLALAIAIMRAAWAQREREALSASDLRAVEESAMLLVEQLKSEAEHGVSELDRRCGELRRLLAEADSKLAELRSAAATVPPAEPEPPACLPNHQPSTINHQPSLNTDDILRMAETGLNPVDIAKATGLDCADVKVALKLGALAAAR